MSQEPLISITPEGYKLLDDMRRLAALSRANTATDDEQELYESKYSEAFKAFGSAVKHIIEAGLLSVYISNNDDTPHIDPDIRSLVIRLTNLIPDDDVLVAIGKETGHTHYECECGHCDDDDDDEDDTSGEFDFSPSRN